MIEMDSLTYMRFFVKKKEKTTWDSIFSAKFTLWFALIYGIFKRLLPFYVFWNRDKLGDFTYVSKFSLHTYLFNAFYHHLFIMGRCKEQILKCIKIHLDKFSLMWTSPMVTISNEFYTPFKFSGRMLTYIVHGIHWWKFYLGCEPYGVWPGWDLVWACCQLDIAEMWNGWKVQQ